MNKDFFNDWSNFILVLDKIVLKACFSEMDGTY